MPTTAFRLRSAAATLDFRPVASSGPPKGGVRDLAPFFRRFCVARKASASVQVAPPRLKAGHGREGRFPTRGSHGRRGDLSMIDTVIDSN
jgi:hypothetical protein